MIVESRGGAVYLSGRVHFALWDVIEATVILLLEQHPGGVIVDCAGLAPLDAEDRGYIDAALAVIAANGLPVALANLPGQAASAERAGVGTPAVSGPRQRDAGPPEWWRHLFAG
jgi:hypothetical protein